MKVLFLVEHDRPKRGNYRLLNPFMRKMSAYCDFEEIVLPDLLEKVEKGYTEKDLYNDYKPDATIVYGNFAPLVDKFWFKNLQGAKIIVIVDFLGHTSNNPGIMERYKQNGFDMMIMRGVYDKNYKSTIPMVWVPFSADEDVFYPKKVKKKRIVGFAGMTGPKYITRRKAIRELERYNLIERCPRTLCNKGDPKKNRGYVNWFRTHIANLTSTDLPKTPRAKTFEIMGAGSVVLTSPFYNMKALLGKPGEGYVVYKPDCSDVVKKAKELIDNPAKAKAIARRGHEIFLEKHTDEIRIKEFYDHIVRLVEGRPIERPWGI